MTFMGCFLQVLSSGRAPPVVDERQYNPSSSTSRFRPFPSINLMHSLSDVGLIPINPTRSKRQNGASLIGNLGGRRADARRRASAGAELFARAPWRNPGKIFALLEDFYPVPSGKRAPRPTPFCHSRLRGSLCLTLKKGRIGRTSRA